ncbi:MAG: rubrerythrin [Eubacteriales bacterium]
MSLKGTRTEQNLLIAFAGESQARNRYTFFASQARKQGYEQIAAFFLETADNEKEHAKRLFKFLEGGDVEVTASFPAGIIGDTAANLKSAASGENHEYTHMYPEFTKIAGDEGFLEISEVLSAIARAEKAHEARFLKLLENIEKGMVFRREENVSWKCANCGYIHEGTEPPETCPACNHPKSYYELWRQAY